MQKKFSLAYKIVFTFFLISQYQQIMNNDNFLAIFSYIILLIILTFDLLLMVYKMFTKR